MSLDLKLQESSLNPWQLNFSSQQLFLCWNNNKFVLNLLVSKAAISISYVKVSRQYFKVEVETVSIVIKGFWLSKPPEIKNVSYIIFI